MKTTDVPPLPVPKQLYRNEFTRSVVYGYTEEQMEAYVSSVCETVKELKAELHEAKERRSETIAMCEHLRADAERYRRLSDRMVHVAHPNGSGWTLDEVLKSDDRDLDETVDTLLKPQIFAVAKKMQIREGSR